MKPIELGRMRIHKVHEMDSPVPLLSQLPGTTGRGRGEQPVTGLRHELQRGRTGLR